VASRPVRGGFALVRIPDAPGVRVELDNQTAGVTDERGDLVLSDLQPFYGSRIRVDPARLPLDAAAFSLERVVAVPRLGGAIVAFGARGAALVGGTVRATRDGAPVDASFAELVLDGASRHPIGHDNRFELEDVPVGTHRAELALDGARCTFPVTVPRGTRLVELGPMTCELHP
ncbi:MAG: fimbria/pilus outer membrane usher protein, partial [Deltaproteobacteria bacterium]|nr:fimbria/pilus outer membrane usher protein [Deltaproteobacteria bacterium]